MGELGALVQAWRDRRDPRPSDAWIGRKVGTRSRSSVRPWLTGESMPQPEHLRRLATLIGVNYRTVLDAALLDAGYLEEREGHGYQPAATNPAGDDPADPSANLTVRKRRSRIDGREPARAADRPPDVPDDDPDAARS